MRTVTSALIGALTVGFVCFHAQAFPSKVGCDLLGESKMNVMERPTIMGEKVQNVDMIKRKQLQLSSDGTGVTITLTINFQMVESDTVGAVIHTSFGKLTGLPNQFISRDCTEFNSSVHYASAGSKLGLNMEVFLEAPTDSPPIYVSPLLQDCSLRYHTPKRAISKRYSALPICMEYQVGRVGLFPALEKRFLRYQR